MGSNEASSFGTTLSLRRTTRPSTMKASLNLYASSSASSSASSTPSSSSPPSASSSASSSSASSEKPPMKGMMPEGALGRRGFREESRVKGSLAAPESDVKTTGLRRKADAHESVLVVQIPHKADERLQEERAQRKEEGPGVKGGGVLKGRSQSQLVERRDARRKEGSSSSSTAPPRDPFPANRIVRKRKESQNEEILEVVSAEDDHDGLDSAPLLRGDQREVYASRLRRPSRGDPATPRELDVMVVDEAEEDVDQQGHSDVEEQEQEIDVGSDLGGILALAPTTRPPRLPDPSTQSPLLPAPPSTKAMVEGLEAMEETEEERRKAIRRIRDRERRQEQRRQLELERAGILEANVPKLRQRKSVALEAPPPPQEEATNDEGYAVTTDLSITILQDDRSLKRCKLIETPAGKLAAMEEVMVPSFRPVSSRDTSKRQAGDPDDDEETDDEAYDRRHKKTEMQERRVRNREKERYLHELQKYNEALERQKHAEVNERIFYKRKGSPSPISSLFHGPEAKRSKLGHSAPSKAAAVASISTIRTLDRPGGSLTSQMRSRPVARPSTQAPEISKKAVKEVNKDLEGFGANVAAMKAQDFKLPEYYFSD